MTLLTPDIENLIDRALSEDISDGDSTTESLFPKDIEGRAVILAKSMGVLAGIDLALAVFNRVDPTICCKALVSDGSDLMEQGIKVGSKGHEVAEVQGDISSILKAERTALNFLQHLSGIATKTRKYVQAVIEYKASILDTRKTIPGMRVLEKYAVRMGGGQNHRFSLGDGILIKDNHIAPLCASGLDIADIVNRARLAHPPSLKIEIEVANLEQVRQALDAGAEVLMLDNMDVQEIALAVDMARGKALTEASGGINLKNVKKIAATGVDLISVGALTHSSSALDMSLDFL